MEAKTLQAAIVGASSPLGRELAEQMASASDRTWDVTLFDTEEASGKISAAGDEAMLVQTLAPGSFERIDAVFFAEDADSAKTHWGEAQHAGAVVVDLTGALRAAGVASTSAPGTAASKVIVPLHPVAVMLAGIALPLKRQFGGVRLAATVLVPASEWGKAGIDELQRQTVGLLSFQSVPKDVFDEQVAFNLTTQFGESATATLADLTATIERDFAVLAAGCELAVQAVQAPVFNAYALSVFATPEGQATLEAVRGALEGGFVQLADAPPSNDSVAGERGIFATVKEGGSAGFWFWLTADNVTLLAQTAIAAARERADTQAE